MVDRDSTIEQVCGILERAGLAYRTHPDGDAFRLRFGTSGVFIHFAHHRGCQWVSVTAPVLCEVDPESAGAALLHSRLNELNADHPFVKFLVSGETLLAACDLVGDRMHRVALLHALRVVVQAAERVGEMAEEVGGVRFADRIDAEDEDDEEFEEVVNDVDQLRGAD